MHHEEERVLDPVGKGGRDPGRQDSGGDGDLPNRSGCDQHRESGLAEYRRCVRHGGYCIPPGEPERVCATAGIVSLLVSLKGLPEVTVPEYTE